MVARRTLSSSLVVLQCAIFVDAGFSVPRRSSPPSFRRGSVRCASGGGTAPPVSPDANATSTGDAPSLLLVAVGGGGGGGGTAASKRRRRRAAIGTAPRTLWSYVGNLQRARRDEPGGESPAGGGKHRGGRRDEKRRLLKPARSLAHFLASNRLLADDGGPVQTSAAAAAVQEPLHRAVIQAMRAAASANDYRLILRLLGAVRTYAGAAPVLEPRIAGEAIDGLRRTAASAAKIGAAWRSVVAAESRGGGVPSARRCWTGPVGALEVNAMLRALTSRGKLRAALDLYRESSARSPRRTDAHSLSHVIKALSDSIAEEQPEAHELPVLQNRTRFGAWLSSCWQWNEAVCLLDEIVPKNVRASDDDERLNNPVLSALLQLNERASQVFHGHGGPEKAVLLLEFMEEENISPDQVTCTLVLSSLGANWELAVDLLRTSAKKEGRGDGGTSSPSWSLPRPNGYMYSAAMAVCARSRQFAVALGLLDELFFRDDDDDDGGRQRGGVDDKAVRPDTWMFNSVLQALVTSAARERVAAGRKARASTRRAANDRLRLAFELLTRMDGSIDLARGLRGCTAPDTVTFNTLFSLVGGVRPYLSKTDWSEFAELYPDYFVSSERGRSHEEALLNSLLDRMVEENVPRDLLTYRHAIQAMGGSNRMAVLRTLDRAFSDGQILRDGATSLHNECFSVLSENGDVDGILQVRSRMLEAGTRANGETTVHVINTLGAGNMSSAVPVLMGALSGKPASARDLYRILEFDFEPESLAPLDAMHYSTAISTCLRARDFASARRVLVQMRSSGLKPSDESLQEIARAYADIALAASVSQTKDGDLKIVDGEVGVLKSAAAAKSLAKSAFAVTKAVNSAPASLISIVAKACGSSGLFQESRSLLHLLHLSYLEQFSADDRSKMDSRVIWSSKLVSSEKIITGLHRSLMKQCADQGNVTNALRVCEDIQQFSLQVHRKEGKTPKPSFGVPSTDTTSSAASDYPVEFEASNADSAVGMSVPEWRSLLTAASRSGHWRVCLTTLQFLRPHLETLHPSKAFDDGDLKRLNQEYRQVESALQDAVNCLAVRSQYAWVVRAIDDWIEWTGRRPPRGAALTAIRVLSSRGRGEEVNYLVTRCTSVPSLQPSGFSGAYEAMLYVGAITSMHHHGLYDTADESFMAAVDGSFFPFNLEREEDGDRNHITLDLHGMNVAVAHSAVRVALHQEVFITGGNQTGLKETDLVIVTGRGRNSALKMRPVLRPEVQRMLVEEFYPPLSSTTVPGNMGAIRVASEDITAWLKHQQRQKGERMQRIAEVLKASGDRVFAALSKVVGSTTAD